MMVHQVVNAYALASGGGGSGSGFSFDADILRLWDVNQGMTLSSGEVSSWADRVASANMLPVNTSFKPDYSATAINGNPGVTCLNSGEALYSSFSSTSATGTFAAVMSFTSSSATYGRLLSLADPAVSSSSAGDESKAYFATLVRNSTSSNVSLFRNNVSSGTHAVGYSTPKLFLLDLNGTDTKLYINNSLAGSIATAAALAITQIGIFREIASGGNEDGKGSVGDIMIVNRALNSTERGELQTAWASKFGL